MDQSNARGTIDVKSVINEGTTFIITLPVEGFTEEGTQSSGSLAKNESPEESPSA